jgi:histone H3
MAAVEEKKTKRSRKDHHKIWSTYIGKLIKDVAPEGGINGIALQELDFITQDLATRVANTSLKVAQNADRKTVKVNDVITGIMLEFPYTLALKSIAKGQSSIDNLNKSKRQSMSPKRRSKSPPKKSESPKRQSKSPPKKSESPLKKSKTSVANRSELKFPPSLAEKYLRKYGASDMRVTSKAPVILAGALEFVISEILEDSNKFALEDKKKRIKKNHLFKAVNDNDTLKQLNLIILGGGVTKTAFPYPDKSKAAKKSKAVKKSKTVKKSKVEGVKSPHRFRPGTVARRDIKTLQNTVEAVQSEAPFERIVRSMAKKANNNNELRVSNSYVTNLQLYIQLKVVDVLRDAYKITFHCKGQTLDAKDIQLAINIHNIKVKGEDLRDEQAKEELSKVGLKKLAQMAGAERISNDAYDSIANLMNTLLNDIVYYSVLLMNNNNMKTLKLDSFIHATQHMGLHVATFKS